MPGGMTLGPATLETSMGTIGAGEIFRSGRPEFHSERLVASRAQSPTPYRWGARLPGLRFSNEGDECNPSARADFDSAVPPPTNESHSLLRPVGPERQDHSPSGPELGQQGRWDPHGPRCDDDSVEWGLFGPPGIAVALPDLDIPESVLAQDAGRAARKLGHDLDRIDAIDERAEHRCLISGACSYLENPVGLS